MLNEYQLKHPGGSPEMPEVSPMPDEGNGELMPEGDEEEMPKREGAGDEGEGEGEELEEGDK